MWKYIDIHSHLYFSKFDADREAVIQKMIEDTIATITVGVDLATSKSAIALADAYPNLFATVGLHPADNHTEQFDVAVYRDLTKHNKVVAIGECGLDYARLPVDSQAEKLRQKTIFEQQIELALEVDLPLMIHCRDAYPDCLDILESYKQNVGDRLKGNFHFFTSPVEIARRCLNLGFTVSFTGPITYGSDYDEVVKFVPLERLMVETDAPFAAPVPYRGQRSEPQHVIEIMSKIALIKDISVEKVREQTNLTAFELFFKKISPVVG